jgi:hypothetical protein
MSDSAARPFVHRSVPSTTTFKDNIFAGKVLFATGGGSGIVYRMVEVSSLIEAEGYESCS